MNISYAPYINITVIFYILCLILIGCNFNEIYVEKDNMRVVYKNGFETDLGGFSAREGTEHLIRTTQSSHKGSYSIKIENRESVWHGPCLRIEQYIAEGKYYKFSAWVKVTDAEDIELHLTTQIGLENSVLYNILAKKSIIGERGGAIGNS
jgi:hypothetical protein